MNNSRRRWGHGGRSVDNLRALPLTPPASPRHPLGNLAPSGGASTPINVFRERRQSLNTPTTVTGGSVNITESGARHRYGNTSAPGCTGDTPVHTPSASTKRGTGDSDARVRGTGGKSGSGKKRRRRPSAAILSTYAVLERKLEDEDHAARMAVLKTEARARRDREIEIADGERRKRDALEHNLNPLQQAYVQQTRRAAKAILVLHVILLFVSFFSWGQVASCAIAVVMGSTLLLQPFKKGVQAAAAVLFAVGCFIDLEQAIRWIRLGINAAQEQHAA